MAHAMHVAMPGANTSWRRRLSLLYASLWRRVDVATGNGSVKCTTHQPPAVTHKSFQNMRRRVELTFLGDFQAGYAGEHHRPEMA